MTDRYQGFQQLKIEKNTKQTINKSALYKQWIKTITNDNGKEFAKHKYIAKKSDWSISFAPPYSSQEGEYTNKLLRQNFPKNKTLDNVKQEDLNNSVKRIQ